MRRAALIRRRHMALKAIRPIRIRKPGRPVIIPIHPIRSHQPKLNPRPRYRRTIHRRTHHPTQHIPLTHLVPFRRTCHIKRPQRIGRGWLALPPVRHSRRHICRLIRRFGHARTAHLQQPGQAQQKHHPAGKPNPSPRHHTASSNANTFSSRRRNRTSGKKRAARKPSTNLRASAGPTIAPPRHRIFMSSCSTPCTAE